MDIFYGTLSFHQSSIICTGYHVGGHTLALHNFFSTNFIELQNKVLCLTIKKVSCHDL